MNEASQAEKRQQRATKNQLPARFKDGDESNADSNHETGTNQLLERCKTQKRLKTSKTPAKVAKGKKDKSIQSKKKKYEPVAQKNASTKLLELAETFQKKTNNELFFTSVSSTVIPSSSQIAEDQKVQETIKDLTSGAERESTLIHADFIQEHDEMEVVQFENETLATQHSDHRERNEANAKDQKESKSDETVFIQECEKPAAEYYLNEIISVKSSKPHGCLINKAVDAGKSPSQDLALIQDDGEMGVTKSFVEDLSETLSEPREPQRVASADAGKSSTGGSALKKSSPLEGSNIPKKRAKRPEKQYRHDDLVTVMSNKFNGQLLRFYYNLACKAKTLQDVVAKATIGFLKPKKNLLEEEIDAYDVDAVRRLVRLLIRDKDPKTGLHVLHIMRHGEKRAANNPNKSKENSKNNNETSIDKSLSSDNLSDDANPAKDVNSPIKGNRSTKKKILQCRTADNRQNAETPAEDVSGCPKKKVPLPSERKDFFTEKVELHIKDWIASTIKRFRYENRQNKP